jgi:cation:H+ antiporter
VSLVVGIVAFTGGLWLLVESVEGLIGSLRAWALAAGMSGVVLGALVLGLDVESTAAGVAATLDDLPGTALGASIGAAIFLMTFGLGVAALIAPFALRPPPAMLGAAVVAAGLCVALAADGVLDRLDGALLLVAFVPLVAAVVLGRPPDAPPTEARPERPRRLVLRVLTGLAGLLVGAELLVFGTGRVVDELELSETVFGLLVIGAAVSFEEVVLEALPAFRGYPELSVGNALGTLVFLVTGSLGVIVLARPIDVPPAVTAYHLPALALGVLLALALLARGRLGRPEGALLIAAYAAYAAGALLR